MREVEVWDYVGIWIPKLDLPCPLRMFLVAQMNHRYSSTAKTRRLYAGGDAAASSNSYNQ